MVIYINNYMTDVLRTRQELKAFFEANDIPSESEFNDLITTVAVLTEDNVFQGGSQIFQGDVAISGTLSAAYIEGVEAEWDGSRSGDGLITGSLTVGTKIQTPEVSLKSLDIGGTSFIKTLSGTNTGAVYGNLRASPAFTSPDIYIPALNTITMLTLNLVGISNTGSAGYRRKFTIFNNNNIVSLIGGVESVGTDIGSNAGDPPSQWNVQITANNSTKAITIACIQNTSETVKWVGTITGTITKL